MLGSGSYIALKDLRPQLFCYRFIKTYPVSLSKQSWKTYILKYFNYLALMYRGRFPCFEIFKDAVVSQLFLEAQQGRMFRNLQLILMTCVFQVLLPDVITIST